MAKSTCRQKVGVVAGLVVAELTPDAVVQPPHLRIRLGFLSLAMVLVTTPDQGSHLRAKYATSTATVVQEVGRINLANLFQPETAAMQLNTRLPKDGQPRLSARYQYPLRQQQRQALQPLHLGIRVEIAPPSRSFLHVWRTIVLGHQ